MHLLRTNRSSNALNVNPAMHTIIKGFLNSKYNVEQL